MRSEGSWDRQSEGASEKTGNSKITLLRSEESIEEWKNENVESQGKIHIQPFINLDFKKIFS